LFLCDVTFGFPGRAWHVVWVWAWTGGHEIQAQAYFPPWSTDPKANCTADELLQIATYGTGWFHDFAGLLAGARTGVFVTGCVAHEERETAGWAGLQVCLQRFSHGFRRSPV
jgi:hypothetical protein